ncbi:M23 family metallopeptidase [bacterium]|nr:M23 family metallopeptidase [bacterium]
MDERHKCILVLVAIAFIGHALYRGEAEKTPQSGQLEAAVISDAYQREQPPLAQTAAPKCPNPATNGLTRLGLGNDPFGLKAKYTKKPAPDQTAKLEQLQKLLASLSGKDPLQSMLRPIDAPQTSGYGIRKDPIEMNALKRHNGTDFAAPQGTQIPCPVAGKVVKAGSLPGYGISVEVQHSQRVSSFYAHLSKALVNEGQDVQAGEIIGLVGSTGRATGDNLHYELRVNGRPVNPQALVMMLAMLSNESIKPGGNQ